MDSDRLWVNGGIVARDAPVLSALDRGFLYGDGFFETTRILQGRPLFLGLHLARLAASCTDTGFGWSPDAGVVRSAVHDLIAANRVQDGYLRITVSRGAHAGVLTDLTAAQPTLVVEARPADIAPLAVPSPLCLARSEWRRNERSPLVRHKALSYMDNVLALAAARRRGADEVYFLNSQARLTEGATSNLFWVRRGAVHTPAVGCGLLPGITRGIVLDICREETLPVREGAFPDADLIEAEEVFCTNGLRGVMGVRSLLDPPHAFPADAPVTAAIRRAYVERALGGERPCLQPP